MVLPDRRRHRRHRQRLRLRRADLGRIEVVSRQARPRHRPDGRRLRRRLRRVRPDRLVADRAASAGAARSRSSSLVFLVMTMVGDVPAAEPAAGYVPAGWDPSKARAASRARRRRARVGDGADADVLGALGRVLSRHDGGHDGDQPAGAVRAQRRALARRSPRSRSPSARSAARRAACCRDGCPITPAALNTLRVMLLVSACAMPLLFLFRENVVLFYAAARARLLLLRHAAVGVRVDERRFLRHEERRLQLRPAAARVGRGRRSSARFSAAASSSRPASTAGRSSSRRRCRSSRSRRCRWRGIRTRQRVAARGSERHDGSEAHGRGQGSCERRALRG